MKNILKQDYEQKITEARKDEREKADKRWKKKIEGIVKSFEKEYEMMFADKNAKIRSLEEQLKEEVDKAKKAEEVYYYCWNQVKRNLDVATQMKMKINTIFDRAQEMYQDVITICDRAELLNNEMKDMDKVNREKLQLPDLKNNK